ncbi:MAG: hypothetical protein U9N32_10350, partial [Spirochaetota bacterium]|nr:hypothetical protein [Spirochaetota bacterium]
ENGFNYDSFRSHFKKSNIGIVQSLMKVSQHFDAVFAGLLVYDGTNWKMDHTLGFNQKSISNFTFTKDEEFSIEILDKKKIFLFKSGQNSIIEIESRLFKGDLSYMSGGLFMPIIFENSSAYMLLGLKTIKTISEYIEILKKL